MGSPHGASDALQMLNDAWTDSREPPSISAFVSPATNLASFSALVRSDAQHRLQRSEPVELEFYNDAAQLAAPDAHGALAPGQELTAVVLSFERMAGHSAAQVRERLGEPYALDIDRAFGTTTTETMTTISPSEVATVGSHGNTRAISAWNKGDTIGAFSLRKKLGEGGFGEVWLASREKPHQQVAVKVLRPDAADEASVKRFEAEAQALAFLEHHYIAKIIDAGTIRGVPYLVMEYVEGKTLTKYCDDHQLSISQRLELMARICEGVQHAHLRGLIHRDLKPDNILVTEVNKHSKDLDERQEQLVVRRTDGKVTVAVPKIVDFGLAKAAEKTVRLSDGTLTVDLGKMMGTPEYMSPEQAGHQPLEVTQQADIFSLGVILYELLSGTLPLSRDELSAKMIDEVVAVLRGTPRPDLSTRLNSLDADTMRRVCSQRGDLSPREFEQRVRGRVRHLCGKALRLEPERRFSSSAAMAQDIRNYLDGRDFVEAAAEPTRDRIIRHIRRHPGPYVTIGTAAVLLVIGIFMTTWQWREAESAREAEKAQRLIAEATSSFLIDDVFGSIDPNQIADSTPATIRSLVDPAAKRINERFADSPQVKQQMLVLFGRLYSQIGAYNSALDLLLSAHELTEELPDPEISSETIDELMSTAYWRSGQGSEALPILNRLLEQASGDANRVASLLVRRGNAFKYARDWDSAIADYEEAIRTAEASDAGEAGDVVRLEARYNLALKLINDGDAAWRQDRLESAEELWRDAFGAMSNVRSQAEQAFGAEAPFTVNTTKEVAGLLVRLNRNEEAEELYEDLLPRMVELYGLRHLRVRRAYADAARAQEKLGDFAAAQRILEITLASYLIAEGGENAATIRVSNRLASAHENLGNLQAAQRLIEDRLTDLRKAGFSEDSNAVQNQLQVLEDFL